MRVPEVLLLSFSVPSELLDDGGRAAEPSPRGPATGPGRQLEGRLRALLARARSAAEAGAGDARWCALRVEVQRCSPQRVAL